MCIDVSGTPNRSSAPAGGKVSNGCIRMLPEDQTKMDGIMLGTPVDIVA